MLSLRFCLVGFTTCSARSGRFVNCAVTPAPSAPQVAEQTHERLEALRREKEAAGLQGCTFQPQLNASSRWGKERCRLQRVLLAVRPGISVYL